MATFVNRATSGCRHLSTVTRTYDDAITLLNTLQTPYSEIQARRKAGVKLDSNNNKKFKTCLEHLGYSISDLNRLNIVHVAGTKGKGSTCAYVDSILRQYRLSYGEPSSVGLFTSPHLISVRERIKINSQTISASKFTKYFFEVWDRFEVPYIKNDVTKSLDRPTYFRFMTLMSYHVFLQERVKAAIYEVGIGGENDSTNIVKKPVVTGITKIGIDHTHLLGETLAEIAWHKAGIFKEDSYGYFTPQVPEVEKVFFNRAKERKMRDVKTVFPHPQLKDLKIQPNFEFQRQNAALAIWLSMHLMKKLNHIHSDMPSHEKPLVPEIVNGLEQVTWRGRCEKIEETKIIWYLDGAHNIDSIKVAAAWFANELAPTNFRCQSTDQPRSRRGMRILIFNQQGHREVIRLLEDLFHESKSNQLKFDHIIFCPTIPDNSESRKDFVNNSTDKKAISELTQQKLFAAKWKVLDDSQKNIHIYRTVEESLEFTRKVCRDEIEKAHVFITGSVHLVGRVLGILEDADSL